MTWVQSLSQEDPLEKEMATHSSHYCLEKIPWTEEPGRLQSMGLQESDIEKKIRYNLATKQHQFREVKKNSLLLG